MEPSSSVSYSEQPACDPALTSPVTFNRVLQEEIDCVNRSRGLRRIEAPATRDNLIGLAFSGGGIRSATFNLGILQALAEQKLLHKFDYLSTVSGGGYIGSWLAALTLRLTRVTEASSFANVEQALRPGKYTPTQRSEPSVLHWLRMYSNYLTPHTGVVSGDTWAMLGTWLRNVVLNQTILGMVFVSLYLLCLGVLVWLVVQVTAGSNDQALQIAAGGTLFLASIMMAIDVTEEEPTKAIRQTFFQRIKVTVTVMLPFVVACILLNCLVFQQSNDYAGNPTWWWALAGAVFYFLVWGVVALMAAIRRRLGKRQGKPVRRMISIQALLIFSPIAGAVGACLLQAYCYLLNQPQHIYNFEWLVVVFGSGVVMTIFLLVGVLHLGLVGRGSFDLVREWWARLGGYLMLITVGWLLLAGTVAFAPILVLGAIRETKNWSITAGVIWILHTYLGLKAAKSPQTSGEESESELKRRTADRASAAENSDSGVLKKAVKSRWVLNALAKAAPYVFLVGLILLVTTVVYIATGLSLDPSKTGELWDLTKAGDPNQQWGRYWDVLEDLPPLCLACIGGAFFLGGLALSWRVDINDFSLHHFYRNRLVRCYLGASNPERRPEPFTGFDPGDDAVLCEFAEDYPGPYPILNAALNITSGEELGYATRRAKSFVFTPLYCGYERAFAQKGPRRFSCDDSFLPSYARTALGRSKSGLGKIGAEGGISLGTAMAISGAAASPNMGYYTAPATAFFMALFDVRLGWWMGNPRYLEKWLSPGPALGLGYLFSEVFAQSDQQKGYVYLSDGGHFENLAVYELIRRHCRVIVVCDADADPHYQFDNLLSLIEKARTDFGARIEIDYAAIAPAAGERQSKCNSITGTIYYDLDDPTDTGVFILIKASMPVKPSQVSTGDRNDRRLPDDVWRYYDQHKTFPHQSTADQWFDELQFESYRALGEFIGVHAAKQIREAIDDTLA